MSRPFRWRAVVLGAGACAATLGCSLAVDAGREQCTTDGDCTSLGFTDNVCVESLCRPRPDPAWACLDEATRSAVASPPGMVRVIVPFVDIVTDAAVPGVEISACERLDSECALPVASATSNDDGEVDLRLPGGFDGYLRWQGEDVYPTMFFIGGPIMADSIIPVDVISPRVFAGLNAQFQDRAIAGRSAVVVYVRNCDGALASGVSLTIPEGDSATQPLYLVDGLFPPSQSETSVAGLSRVINVPPGNVSIVGHLSDGREMGRTAILARTGFATLTELLPNTP